MDREGTPQICSDLFYWMVRKDLSYLPHLEWCGDDYSSNDDDDYKSNGDDYSNDKNERSTDDNNENKT